MSRDAVLISQEDPISCAPSLGTSLIGYVPPSEFEAICASEQKSLPLGRHANRPLSGEPRVAQIVTTTAIVVNDGFCRYPRHE